MGENRIAEWIRDPTFETPSMDYFEVRMPWVSFAVTREAAERILEAIVGLERKEWVRAETVAGSVVHVRTKAVVYVREWTRAQRAAEERFWRQLEQERQENEDAREDPEVDPDEGITPEEPARRAEGAVAPEARSEPTLPPAGRGTPWVSLAWIVWFLLWVTITSLR